MELWDWTKTSEAVGQKNKTVSWKVLKCSKKLRGTADVGDNSERNDHYDDPSHIAHSPLLIYQYWLVQL